MREFYYEVEMEYKESHTQTLNENGQHGPYHIAK